MAQPELCGSAYDADWLRRQIEAAGAAPNIPPMVHRRWKPCFSPRAAHAAIRVAFFEFAACLCF
jgi:hypothetical protein